MLGAALRLFLLEFVAVHESGYGPFRPMPRCRLMSASGELRTSWGTPGPRKNVVADQ